MEFQFHDIYENYMPSIITIAYALYSCYGQQFYLRIKRSEFIPLLDSERLYTFLKSIIKG